MKKYFLLTLIISLFVSTLTAQEKDDKSKTILNDVSAKVKSYNSLKIDFTYKMENKKEKVNENINGTLYLKKEKYRLEFSGQTIICDGKTTWTYSKESNEVQINNLEESDDAITPNNIFTLYEKGHRSKFIRDGEEKGKKVAVIELVPTAQKSYFKVRLNIEKTTNQLVSAVVFDRNGGTFTYELTKLQPNVTIGDDKFTFNAASYPKVEIIDLR